MRSEKKFRNKIAIRYRIIESAINFLKIKSSLYQCFQFSAGADCAILGLL